MRAFVSSSDFRKMVVRLMDEYAEVYGTSRRADAAAIKAAFDAELAALELAYAEREKHK